MLFYPFVNSFYGGLHNFYISRGSTEISSFHSGMAFLRRWSALASPSGAGPRPGSVYRDTLAGLEGLGYSEVEAGPVIKQILHDEPDLDVSGALRAALKAMARIRQGEPR